MYVLIQRSQWALTHNLALGFSICLNIMCHGSQIYSQREYQKTNLVFILPLYVTY